MRAQAKTANIPGAEPPAGLRAEAVLACIARLRAVEQTERLRQQVLAGASVLFATGSDVTLMKLLDEADDE